MFNKLLILDWETRWSSKPVEWAPDAYTLSKMTTEEYIRSPLFKGFGLGVKYYGEDGAPIYITHPFLKKFFGSIDWSTTAVAAHNSAFDIAILTWIYGIKPAFIFDTLSMARALYGIDVGNSAKKLAERFNLPPKGFATQSSDGLYELTPQVEQELADYCKHDVYLCEKFLDNMLPQFPKKELKLIDATIRMFTEPQLALDKDLLQGAIDDDATARATLLGKLGVLDEQLASNDKFAETLRAVGVDPPTKISPTTGKEAYAFAKNDALFQQILNGDNEEAVLLCEARMKVKSTQERTRAQRFLDIAGRADGLLPVPVNYAHTRTLRWGAAKGSNINMQNLKRGGKLRKSIVAPPGYKCVAGDLSQIEPRVLAHLADFTELLEIFASGKDAYAQFGAGMFGIPGLSKESHPDLRQSAKSALLGCFAAGTQVLTRRGWTDIVQVGLSDQLWDGESWVTHSGLLNQGMKDTFFHQGVWATEDHEILTAHGWQAWSEVRTKTSLFQSALSLARLPSSIGAAQNYTEVQKKDGILSFDVHVDGKDLLDDLICSEDVQHDAIPAQRKKEQRHEKLFLSMPLSLMTPRTGCAFSTEFAQSLLDAKTRSPKFIPTTAGGEYAYTSLGWRSGQISYATSSLSMGGTSPSYSLTELITTKDTNPGIFDSVRAVLTCLTSVKFWRETWKNLRSASQTLKKKTLTYDIGNVGPRNRFMVKTDAGPILVHNCGYRLGWASFASQLLVGFLGAPPVRYDRAFMKQLGISGQTVVEFMTGYPHEGRRGAAAGAERLERMMEIPHTCTDKELLVHCVCAKEIIDRYRRASEPIVSFWGFLDKMIATVLAVPDAAPVTHKCLTFMPGKIKLPNGLFMTYDKIKVETDDIGRPQYSYWNGKTYKALHSGIVAENVTSGTARCVIGDGMLRVQPRYPVCLTVHDELVVLVKDEEVDFAKAWIKEQITAPVKYLPGIPLNAEVGAAYRYGESKA